ncbi:MAG: helix-turn-helix transcriptional regulator [Clostridia bacterium]
MTILDVQKMKALRVKNELSQEALALKANLSTHFIGKIERGSDNITLDSLQRIAEALEVNPTALLKSQLEVATNDFLWEDQIDKARKYQQCIYMMETFDTTELTIIYLNIKLVFDSKVGASKW